MSLQEEHTSWHRARCRTVRKGRIMGSVISEVVGASFHFLEDDGDDREKVKVGQGEYAWIGLGGDEEVTRVDDKCDVDDETVITSGRELLCISFCD